MLSEQFIYVNDGALKMQKNGVSWRGAPLFGLNHGTYRAFQNRLKITEQRCTIN